MAGPTKATRPDPLPFVSGSCWTGTERSTLATARSLAAPDRGGPARATRRRTRPARPREAHFTHPRHSAALAAGDNAKTGLNRDSFGTVARPGAPPHRRASGRRTRCGRAARRRAALGDCWRQATHAAILVAAHCQCANQSASISSNARCSFFILWPQPSADARTAYKPTDNAKTGLNRDCFGTLAPGARLDHRAPAAAGRDAAEERR